MSTKCYGEEGSCPQVALPAAFPKRLPNLSIREQRLLPVLDVFRASFVRIRPNQGGAAFLLQMVTKTQHAAVEHRGVHCKQDQGHPAATLQKQGTRHRPSGDPLRYHRKASDSQLLTSFSELHPCTTREERDTQDGGTARPQGSSTRRFPTCGKSGPFTPEELVNALKHIEPGK